MLKYYFLLSMLFVTPAFAQSASVDDMFAETPATAEEKPVERSLDASPLSLFDEGIRDEDEIAKSADPLNDVVLDWLSEEKSQVNQEIEAQKKARASQCSSRPLPQLYLTAERRCDEEKARQGFSCWDQKQQAKERSKIFRQQRAKELARKQEAWDRLCANYDPNSDEPDPALQGQLDAVNRQIEAETKAAQDAAIASLKRSQSTEEQAAYDRKNAEDAARKAEIARKQAVIDAERQQREKQRAEQDAIQRKHCRAEFFERNVLWCGCSQALSDVDLSGWKTCSK